MGKVESGFETPYSAAGIRGLNHHTSRLGRRRSYFDVWGHQALRGVGRQVPSRL